MRQMMIGSLALATLFVLQAQAQDKAAKDQLKGTWTVVSEEKNGKLTHSLMTRAYSRLLSSLSCGPRRTSRYFPLPNGRETTA
jgi:hypothetical protein